MGRPFAFWNYPKYQLILRLKGFALSLFILRFCIPFHRFSNNPHKKRVQRLITLPLGMLLDDFFLAFGHAKAHLVKFFAPFVVCSAASIGNRHCTPLHFSCKYEYTICKPEGLPSKSIYTRMYIWMNCQLMYVRVHDIMLTENKTAAVQRSWRSFTPAQVIPPPTQRT